MSLGPAKAALRAYLEANFTTCPIYWPNERVSGVGTLPTPFVFAEVQGVDNEQHTINPVGSRLFLHSGVILLSVFTTFGQGSSPGDAIVDELAALLVRRDIPAPTVPQIVRTEDPVSHDGEQDDQNAKLFRLSLSCSFDFYHTA